jgi:hypothetical protein
MAGDQLHQFQLQLLDYLRANFREHLADRHFRRRLAEELPAPLLAYLTADGGDEESGPLVLSNVEMAELQECAYSSNRQWRPYPELHQ